MPLIPERVFQRQRQHDARPLAAAQMRNTAAKLDGRTRGSVNRPCAVTHSTVSGARKMAVLDMQERRAPPPGSGSMPKKPILHEAVEAERRLASIGPKPRRPRKQPVLKQHED